MKKILIVLVIISSFFTFQSALKKYDELIFEKIISYESSGQMFTLAIGGELNEDGLNTFQKNFTKLLDKHGLYSYQRLNTNNEHIIWAYTTDMNYLSDIALTDGNLTSIKEGDYYFSNDGDQKGVIFNPIRNENIKIYHLNDFSNKHKSIFIPYILVMREGNIIDNVNQFVTALKKAYPDLTFNLITSEMHKEPIQVDYEDIVFVVLISLMVILGLNLIIIRQTKKVQILKLEGYNNWQIYRKQILIYIGIIILVNIMVNIGLYFYYMETSFKNTKPFFVYLATPTFIFMVSLLLLSISSFITIMLIDANLAIKGKNSLKKQLGLNYVLKTALIVTTTIIVQNGIENIKQYYNIITTEQEYLNSIENVFRITSIKSQYLGLSLQMDSDTDSEKEEKIKRYLSDQNSYFEIDVLEELPMEGTTIPMRAASKEYIKRVFPQDILNEITEDKFILIPDTMASYVEEIRGALSDVRYSGFEGIGKVYVYPNMALDNIRPTDYIWHGQRSSNLVIMVDTGARGNVGFFKYFGNEDEAQDYYDQVYADHDSVAIFSVESVKEQYLFWRSYFFREFNTMLPIFIMILLTLLTNTYQLAILNCEINDKKFAVLKSEGNNTIDLIKDVIIMDVFLLLVAETILYRFRSVSFRDLAYIIIIYFVVDVLVFWGTTNWKMKNFPERLR